MANINWNWPLDPHRGVFWIFWAGAIAFVVSVVSFIVLAFRESEPKSKPKSETTLRISWTAVSAIGALLSGVAAIVGVFIK